MDWARLYRALCVGGARVHTSTRAPCLKLVFTAPLSGGLDFSAPVKKFFFDPLGSGRPFVDTVVSLTGFALVGGPARQDAPKAIEALKSLNVPYLVSLPLVFQTTEEWLDSELGVHPVQVALQVRRAWGPAGVG